VDLVRALGFARDRHQGVLTTVRRDGRPHLANVVFVLGEDDVARISTRGPSVKVGNLRREPRCALYLPGDNFWSYVVLDATAEVTNVVARPDDPVIAELIDLYRAVQGEHPDWDEFRQAMVDEQRVVVRLRPERAYGMVSR
jgi:PPOX class probable F420-dependent enzyme